MKNDERNANTEMCRLSPENGNVSSEGRKSNNVVEEIFCQCQNQNTDKSEVKALE